jgi:hypothetical protein
MAHSPGIASPDLTSGERVIRERHRREVEKWRSRAEVAEAELAQRGNDHLVHEGQSSLHALSHDDLGRLLRWGSLDDTGSRAALLHRLERTLAAAPHSAGAPEMTSRPQRALPPTFPAEEGEQKPVLYDPLSDWAFELHADLPRVTLGRASAVGGPADSTECVLPEAGKAVSRRHAAIEHRSEGGARGFYLSCLHHKNQILHNGQPLHAEDDAVRLNAGDRIIVGPVLLFFAMDGDVASGPPDSEEVSAALASLSEPERRFLFNRNPSLKDLVLAPRIQNWLSSAHDASSVSSVGSAQEEGSSSVSEFESELHAGHGQLDQVAAALHRTRPRTPPSRSAHNASGLHFARNNLLLGASPQPAREDFELTSYVLLSRSTGDLCLPVSL